MLWGFDFISKTQAVETVRTSHFILDGAWTADVRK
jgi:hypothetical protein